MPKGNNAILKLLAQASYSGVLRDILKEFRPIKFRESLVEYSESLKSGGCHFGIHVIVLVNNIVRMFIPGRDLRET